MLSSSSSSWAPRTPSAVVPASESLRADGNELYCSGKLIQATKKYLEAIALSPDDPAPLRTLSAARFELGDYSGCIEAIRNALSLEDDTSKVQVLQVREVKCLLHLRRYEEAVAAAEKLDCGGVELKRVVEAARYYQKRDPFSIEDERKELRDRADTPIYRPNLHTGMYEYYARGHDTTFAAMRHEQIALRARKSPPSLSFFYGGVGDARHFYQQLHHLCIYHKNREQSASSPSTSNTKRVNGKFFFTVQDLKPHMMARNLVVFQFLQEYNTADLRIADRRARKKEKLALLTAIWYIFACDIMPKYIYERLEGTMHGLLRAGENFDIPWLRCDARTSSAIRIVFRSWLTDRHKNLFDVKHAQTCLQWFKEPERLKRLPFKNFMLKGEWDQYSGFDARDGFGASLLVYPPRTLMSEQEPDLVSLIHENERKSPERRRKVFSLYARREWKINITLLQEIGWYSMWDNDWNDTCDALEIIERLWEDAVAEELIEEPGSILDPRPSISEMCLPFFRTCAGALSNLDVVVEFRIGDVNNMLDTIRYKIGLDENRSSPNTYDAIFLSNIPDYTGGHLTTIIHSIPLLKNSRSYVRTNILVNPICFREGHVRALSEYLCLPSFSTARAFTGLVRFKKKEGDIVDTAMDMFTPAWMKLTEAVRWGYVEPEPALLPPKATVTRWLTQVFYKLALPVPRLIHESARRINQPLTLSTFIRLCVYLVENRKYPTHWISSLVDSLLGGEIVTTVRLPATAPLELKELDHMASIENADPAKTYSATAFLPELRALLIRQQAILPFTLLTPLPNISTVRRYKFRFEIIDQTVGPTQQILGLIFISPFMDKSALFDLHHVLTRDTKTSPEARDARGKVYLVSCSGWQMVDQDEVGLFMNFDVDADVWMERETMDTMRADGWGITVMRTDRWTPVSFEVLVRDAVEL